MFSDLPARAKKSSVDLPAVMTPTQPRNQKEGLAVLVIGLLLFASCKKEETPPTPAPRQQGATIARATEVSASPADPKAGPDKVTSPPRADKMLLIVVDTLRADRLGAYGYDKPTTPTMNALASEGVRFESLRAASPWTAPSFGALYTGVSPTVHGAGAMLAKGSQKGHDVLGVTVGGIRRDLPTLAELMPEEMVTAGFVTNSFMSESLGMARGFDHYDQRNNSVHRYRKADDVTDRALKWLDANSDKPFFMLLHYIDPHMGYGPM
jgi:hypothetical protein